MSQKTVAPMHCLEIAATLEFLKPIPDYSDIDCTQRILAFVIGDQPPAGEFQRLEAFRRAVLRLMEEGLRHEPGCEASEPPHVRLKVVAGPECEEPRWKLELRLGLHEDGKCWDLWISRDDGEHVDFLFPKLENAFREIKRLLDHESREWSACVVFAPPAASGGEPSSSGKE